MFTSIQFESTPINVEASVNAGSDNNAERLHALDSNDSTFFDENEETTTDQVNVAQLHANNSNGSINSEENIAADQTNGNNASQMNEQARLAQIDANVEELLTHGQKVVYDDEVEYIHMPEQQLKAIERLQYRIKSNDILCGNKPFKENVSIFQFV